MSLVLEAVASQAAPYALDELSGLEPCPAPAIYYITPDHPNCLVDIQDVWDEKCAAMDALESQLIHFGGPCSPEEEALRARLVPGWAELSTSERGLAWTGHGSGLLSVPWRHIFTTTPPWRSSTAGRAASSWTGSRSDQTQLREELYEAKIFLPPCWPDCWASPWPPAPPPRERRLANPSPPEPTTPDTLTIAVTKDENTLAPFTHVSSTGLTVNRLVYDTLFHHRHRQQRHPLDGI